MLTNYNDPQELVLSMYFLLPMPMTLGRQHPPRNACMAVHFVERSTSATFDQKMFFVESPRFPACLVFSSLQCCQDCERHGPVMAGILWYCGGTVLLQPLLLRIW